MTTKTISRVAMLASLLLATPACITGEVPIGEDEQLLAFDPPATGDAACSSYCTVAASKGCPPTGDCLAVCAAEREASPGCEVELDAVLACAGHHLDPRLCGVPMESRDEPPPDEPGIEAWHACLAAIDVYGTCVGSDPDGASRHVWNACGIQGAGILGAPRPEGDIDAFAVDCERPYGFTVSLDVACAAGGVCSCLIDGEVAHTCQNLLHAGQLTLPGRGCCGRFFEDFVDGE